MTGGALSQNAFRLRGKSDGFKFRFRVVFVVVVVVVVVVGDCCTGFAVDGDGVCCVVGDFMFVNSCRTFCFRVVVVVGGCVLLVVVCIAGDFVPGDTSGRFDGVAVFVLVLVVDTEKAVGDFGFDCCCCCLC